MEREVIRLEQFRQLRKEIRGSEDYLVVGIDVAKDKHDAYMGTPAAGSNLAQLQQKSPQKRAPDGLKN